ncbi:MAG: hypothetical protein ACLRYB_18145 [Segatella copri]
MIATSLKESICWVAWQLLWEGFLVAEVEMVEYSQGRKVQNVFGADGVKKLANGSISG